MSSENYVDPIDEFCLLSVFDEAAEYISGAKKLKTTTEQKLQFYALFKQATEGVCTRPQPGLLDFVERSKWNAWKALGKMTKDEAIFGYVNLLEKIAPQWKEEYEQQQISKMNQTDKDSDNDSDDDKNQQNQNGLQIAPTMSRPIFEDDEESNGSGSQEEKLFGFAREGDLAGLKGYLQNFDSGKIDLLSSTRDGCSILHLAVDGNHGSVVEYLLRTALQSRPEEKLKLLHKADLEGQTPLHYACVCEYTELIKILIQEGASTNIQDDNGETPMDIAPDHIRSALSS